MLLSMNSLSHILPQRNAQQRLISSLVGSGKALAVAHRSNGGIGGHEASLPRETPRMVGIGLRNPINTTVGGWPTLALWIWLNSMVYGGYNMI